MGGGFSVQMIFVYIDNAEGGFTKGLPGTNHEFLEDSAWDRAIILSPQQIGRVKQEVESKAADMKDAIVIPSRTKGAGRTISGSVKMADLGEGDPATWGYQVIMQSNEGFPAETDLLTRKVNEFEGQHRFGGGTDYDCDPHVMDILGDHAWLQYECEADGTPKKMASVGMVRK
jgi:carbohydrate-binding DOMON domain-containing protein